MIKATLILQDGKKIEVLIRERTYKKLKGDIKKLSFLQKLKILFSRQK